MNERALKRKSGGRNCGQIAFLQRSTFRRPASHWGSDRHGGNDGPTAPRAVMATWRGSPFEKGSCENGGGGAKFPKTVTPYRDPLQKWRSGGAPTPPNGVLMSGDPLQRRRGESMEKESPHVTPPGGNGGGARREHNQRSPKVKEGWEREGRGGEAIT